MLSTDLTHQEGRKQLDLHMSGSVYGNTNQKSLIWVLDTLVKVSEEEQIIYIDNCDFKILQNGKCST